MRIPLTVDLHINQFNGATITEMDAGMTNAIVGKRGGILYATQRPSIDVFEDASVNVSDSKGRAVYYWDAAEDLYLVNDGTLYKNSHASVVSTALTAGTKKCKFIEAGGVLVLLDAQNNQGFTITTGDVVAEITDVDFPPKQTPAVPLAYGGAALDTYFFVLGENGVIYNSDINDPTAWAALDFLDAERAPDGGQYLGKHHDNIVVLGVRTIEFFYDAANPVGSPLSRRQDISYQIGCTDGESVWEEGDRTFFIGNNFSGSLSVFVLENFALRKISTPDISALLTQAITKDGYYINGSGFTSGEHTYYVLNVYTTLGNNQVATSLIYDDRTSIWGQWETTVNGLTKFPLMDWSIRTGVQPRYGEGILFNGDLISINDNFIPQDTLLASTYVATGYVSANYVLSNSGAGVPINMKIRTGQSDGGSDVKKTMSRVRHVGDLTTTAQNLTIKWAKENNASFSAGKTIDTSKFQRVNRIAAFRRINFEVDYSGTEVLRIEALEGKIKAGTN